MASFFGCPSAPDSALHIRALDQFGRDVREASQFLSSFSPRVDQDLRDFPPADTSESTCLLGEGSKRLALIGGGLQEVVDLAAESMKLQVLLLSSQARPAVELGRSLGPGKVWTVGAWECSRAERDELRRTQRLLSLAEMTLERALRACADEIGAQSLLVSLHLDLFDASVLPEVATATFQGVQPRELFRCLCALRERPPEAFQIWGGPLDGDGSCRTSRLAAEILRDAILTWWGVEENRNGTLV